MALIVKLDVVGLEDGGVAPKGCERSSASAIDANS